MTKHIINTGLEKCCLLQSSIPPLKKKGQLPVVVVAKCSPKLVNIGRKTSVGTLFFSILKNCGFVTFLWLFRNLYD